jgi:hypothetical protein
MGMNPRLLRPTASGFDPRRIAGLLLWTDVADQSRAFTNDAATTLAGNDDAVAVMKSKVGPNLTQTVLANRPQYKTGLRAGKAGLRFDGTNDSMAFSSTITQALGQHIFAAVNTTNLGTSFRIFLERTSGSLSNLALYFGGTQNYRPGFFWNNNASVAVWTAAVQAPAVIRWHYNTNYTEVQVNGGQAATGTGGVELTSWSSVTNSGSQQSAIDLYELLIYSSLTAAQVATVNKYLQNRWSI